MKWLAFVWSLFAIAMMVWFSLWSIGFHLTWPFWPGS